MNLSAVVITYNEEKYLAQCLEPLQVFDELIVVDLGSSDESISIGKKYATKFINHEWVPIVEFAFADIIQTIENDWVLHVDPDEVYPECLLEKIKNIIKTDNNYCQIKIPFQYYFKGKPLNYTVWGGIRYFEERLININRVKQHRRVHGSVENLQNFTFGQIDFSANSFVRHYWGDSYHALFEKHNRYITLEGKSRYERGERFTWKRWLYFTLRAIYKGFLTKRKVLPRSDELFLILFFAWYTAKSLLALRKYQQG